MFSHVTAWGYFWGAWVLTALGVEAYWLIVNTANTLSRQVWGVEHLNLSHPFDFSQWTLLHYLIAITLWGLFAWLSVHLVFGLIR